ncbi:MAG: PAS domain S-box protein, partial [bacterium]
MESKRFKNLKIADHILPIGIGLAALHWILESFLHVFVFSDGTTIQQIVYPDSHELWMRTLVIILILCFAYYVRSIVSHLERARDETKFAYTELNQIFNTAADGMCVIDKGFNVLRINDTLLMLLGINHEQAIARKCYEIFPGSLCHTIHCPMAKILAGEDRIVCDDEKELAGGISIPCIVSATPFRENTGELVGIVEDLKDISERKRSEEELAKYRFHLEDLVQERTNELIRTNERLQEEIHERRRTEKELRKTNELLESIFTNIHFLIAYMDSGFRFTRVNRAYAEVTGHDPEFLNGRHFFDFFPDRKKEEIFHEVIAKGEPYFAFQKPFEFPGNSQHGVSFWDWSLHPVREVDGRVEGLILCLINVTERRQAEEALKESEDKYSALVERAKDGVFIVQEGIFSFTKKAMAELIGYPVDEMTGMSLQDLVTPEYREEI